MSLLADVVDVNHRVKVVTLTWYSKVFAQLRVEGLYYIMCVTLCKGQYNRRFNSVCLSPVNR